MASKKFSLLSWYNTTRSTLKVGIKINSRKMYVGNLSRYTSSNKKCRYLYIGAKDLLCLFPFSTTTKSNLHKNLFGSPPHRGAILLSNNTVSFCLIDMAFLHLLVCNYVKSFKTLLLKHVQLDETIFQSKKNKK